jgi:uncharacterized protein (UPF0332 family)
MDQARIRIAEKNVQNYLREGKLRRVKRFEEIVYKTYLKNAEESLLVAIQTEKAKLSSLWVVVTSYYSMFYMACAYLYKLGLKAGDEIVHQVVTEALLVHGRHKIKNYLLDNYSEEKEKALVVVDNYLDNYEREKIKRSTFQYETTETIKQTKAQTSLQRAKEFFTLINEILINSKH